MTITKKETGSTLEIALKGRLDTETSPQLAEELKTSLINVEELVMDFKDLDYVSSAGLRVLLSANKTLYGKGIMKIINANDIVKEIFEVTGFDTILTVE